MDRENIENNIKKNYKDVKNYLQGDPGAEGFIDNLADLEQNFANYLIEILKTKYGENVADKSIIYKKHIKGSSNNRYIHDEWMEHIISNKVLGTKVSIGSLLDEGIKKHEELFNTQESFFDALNSGKLQSIQLNGVIIPSDSLPTQITGSGKGIEKKELSQNKLLLLIRTLREIGIYDDDLIFYIGKIDKNMVRENTYCAMFIPRINKTVFINIGYGEASFICEGEISITKMTSYGKEKLQSELGAKKIIFSENDIKGRKDKLTNFLLGKESKPGRKINAEEIKNRIKKTIRILNELKEFYDEYKEDTFKDSKGNKVQIKDIFSNTMDYYRKNYKIVNKIFNINLPSTPEKTYGATRNELKKYLGIKSIFETQTNVMTLDELKEFYDKHKEDTFEDSDGKKAQIKSLFIRGNYYFKNYKIVNEKYNINLPSYPVRTYNMTRNQFKTELGIKKIREIPKKVISLKELKEFYDEHKEDPFINSEGKKAKIKDLFSNSLDYYTKNYKRVNKKFKINLPRSIEKIYSTNWNQLKTKLGIKEFNAMQRKVISLEELKEFYDKYKEDTFINSEGKTVQIKDLFRSIPYYRKNYKLVNKQYNINLPSSPDKKTYGKTFEELRTFLSKEGL